MSQRPSGSAEGQRPLAGVWGYPPRFPLGVGGRGVQIALTRLRAFAIINLTGQKPAHEGGNVAQWQSGRFISARSQVRTLSLPHQPRRPIGRLDSRAVSSVVRALASHARGPRFDPSTAHQGPGAVGADEGDMAGDDDAGIRTPDRSPVRMWMSRSGGTADALRSGRSTLMGVWVQIPPSAPKSPFRRDRFGSCACSSVG